MLIINLRKFSRFGGKVASFAGITFLLLCLTTVIVRGAQLSPGRYLQVKSFQGEVTFNGQPVQVGDRLLVNEEEEEGFVTNEGASAILEVDDGIGSVYVSEDTELKIEELRTVGGGGKVTELAMRKGRVKVKVRRFRNRRSRFRIKTPSTSAGVRGTDMGTVVLPNGETKLAVLDGTAMLEGDGPPTEVGGGLASTIDPGGPPSPPSLTSGSEKFNLEVLPGSLFRRVRVTASINPANFIFINGQQYQLSQLGELDVVVALTEERSLEILVRTPLGSEQVYNLALPYYAIQATENISKNQKDISGKEGTGNGEQGTVGNN